MPRSEYEAAFPQHADALREMKPQWRCPRCRKDVVLEETCQTQSCPDRGDGSSAVAESPATKFDLREYELIEELGKGGMGEVYRSGDPALGRDLAIKVMKAKYCGHDEAERRFLREARVTGSLQHPGIVPVYNLGQLADGRVHYTMRLVRGRTFADILKEEGGKPERLPSLLSIFEKICQAVAYAHSKRVIHRDLKPHNVMVGKFGEVQVMDWGLAKVLTPDDTAEAEETMDIAGTRIFTEFADTPVDLSRTGFALGTLQYMPSEQARGKWNAVDERADVFALGSILCEILTGHPAYIGLSSSEIIDRVERGDVSETLHRLQQCGADAALTTLCRECLSPHREDRPRDAAAVAKRAAEYQAEVQERLRRAEMAETEARARTEEELKTREQAEARLDAERRARRSTLSLVATVLLALTLASGGGMWYQRKAMVRKNAEYHYLLGQLLLQKNAPGGEARAEFWKAIELDPNSVLFQNALLDSIYFSSDVSMNPNEAIAECRKVIELDPKNSRAHLRFGDVLKKYGRRNEAIVEYTKAIELAPKDFQAHLKLGWTLKGVGRLDEAVVEYTKAIDLAPNDSQAHLARARILFDNGHVDDAIVALRNALELNPHDYTIQYEIGNFFYRARRLDEAIAEYKKAIEIFPFHLLPKNYAYVHTDLGKALQDKGRLDEAIAEFQKVVAVIPINDFAGVTAHVRLVKALHDRGRLDESIAEYKKMIEFLPERRFNDKENLAMLEPIAVALQSKLPAFLEGKYEPRDNAERLVFARLCVLSEYYRGLARLFADAFAAKPKWASDLEAGERYDAARSAALAAAGRGKDACQLPDKSVAMFRRWALGWLRDDLRAYAKLAAQNNPKTNQEIQQRLSHWRSDADLASVRDPSALNRLPESERAAWQALWRDVDELAKRVAKTSEPKATQNKPKR